VDANEVERSSSHRWHLPEGIIVLPYGGR
jgi:hypothetical protein